MKTKLFLFAALIFSAITFAQTSKKGYDYYKATSDSKMNKAELIDAMAKDAGNFINSRQGRKPQTGKEIKSTSQTKDLHLRRRPGRSQGDPVPGIGITIEQGFGQTKNNNLRKRLDRTKAIDQ